MMTYIFIGLLMVIGAAVFFTLRSDDGKSKEIERLQGTKDSLNHAIDNLSDELELLRSQNNLLREEKMNFKKKSEFLEYYSRKLEEENRLIKHLLQNISEVQLKRWDQLVSDCMKPIAGRKRPINVGGLFTRGTIISVGGIIQAIRNLNEGAAQ